MDMLAVFFLTLAICAGFVCLMTGVFFSRANFWLPFGGVVGSAIALSVSASLFVEVLAIIAMTICGFLAAATHSAGRGS